VNEFIELGYGEFVFGGEHGPGETEKGTDNKGPKDRIIDLCEIFSEKGDHSDAVGTFFTITVDFFPLVEIIDFELFCPWTASSAG
jgi:hypothetical protein